MANNFAGSFAQGLVSGYVTGQRLREDRERHDAEMKRIKDDQDMRAGVKDATADQKVQNQFVVTAPDGSTMSADNEKAAAALAKGVDGAQVSQAYAVGGQQFGTQAEADKAAFIANDPITKAQRVAAVYNQYGKPDMAMATMQQANAVMDIRAKDTFQNINQQISSGDFAGLSKTYGAMNNDPSIQITQGQDGSVIVTRAGDGGTPTMMHAYKSADDFRAAAAGMLENSPKEMLAQYWLQKKFDADQNFRTKQLGLDSQRLGIQAGSAAETAKYHGAMLGFQQDNADRAGNPVSFQTGLGASGNVYTTPIQRHWDPNTKSYDVTVGEPVDTGVQPVRTSPFGGLFPTGAGGRVDPKTAVGNTDFGKVPAVPSGPAPQAAPARPVAPTSPSAPTQAAAPGLGLRTDGTPFVLPTLPAGSYPYGYTSPGVQSGQPGTGLGPLSPAVVPYDPNRMPSGYPVRTR